MPIKLITLNIEDDKHFDTVMPFLQQQSADVICLQEVFEADLQQLTNTLGGTMYFAARNYMQKQHPIHPPRGVWGIAIWVRDELEHAAPQTHYYFGTEQRARTVDDPENNARPVLVVTCKRDQEQFVIATTHFTWTPNAEADDRQRTDVQALLQALQPFPELILCGDFNAPRGKEIFSTLCERFTDNVPASVTSTLDPQLHRLKGSVDLVVDSIFSTPGYSVTNVGVVDGISDHKAIVATISRSPL